MSSIILVFFHKFFKIFLYSIFWRHPLLISRSAGLSGFASASAALTSTALSQRAKHLLPEQEVLCSYWAAGSAPPLSRIR